MNIRRVAVLVLIGLLATLALTACGGGTSTPSAPAGQTFNVDASEFAFSPNAFSAKVAQKITFKITSKGTLDHTFVIFGLDGKEAAKAEIKIGATATLDFTPAAAGVYQIDCDIPGHKDAGMQAKLTVTQ